MSIPTEAERLASYKESMAKTVAANGGSVGNKNWAPGSGAIQTQDTARRIHEMAQKKEAQANTLTPDEIIRADAAGRAIARQQAELAGKTSIRLRTFSVPGVPVSPQTRSASHE